MSVDKFEVVTDKDIIAYVKKKADFMIMHKVRKCGDSFPVYTSSDMYIIDTKTGEVKRRLEI